MMARVSYEEDCPGVYPFDEITAMYFGFEKELFVLKT